MRSRLLLAATLLMAVAPVCSAAKAAVPGAYAQTPYAPHAPYAGPVNATTYRAPPFKWGWFGAERFHPQVRWGRDYHGELMRWSRSRTY